MSLVLLVGAGLFLRTVHNLRRVETGFNARNVLLFRISPALNGYDSKKRNLTYDGIGERLRGIGGVQSVAWSNPALMSGREFGGEIFIQGRAYPQRRGDRVSGFVVSPSFFRTMEIPVVAGRGFTESDIEGAPPVAVINEEAARRYFPNESPLGRRFRSEFGESGEVEIVGILRDAKYNSIRAAAPPTLTGRSGNRRRSPRRSRCERQANRLPQRRPSARQSEPSTLTCRSSTSRHNRSKSRAGSGKSGCLRKRAGCSEPWRCSWRRSDCSA